MLSMANSLQYNKKICKKSGKSINELHKEYNIAKSTICKWTADYNNSGSFKAVDNRTPEENEMIRLIKELAQLQMENDILKQATLIMA